MVKFICAGGAQGCWGLRVKSGWNWAQAAAASQGSKKPTFYCAAGLAGAAPWLKDFLQPQCKKTFLHNSKGGTGL